MKRLIAALVLSTVALAGCMSLGEMKLRDGETGCDSVTTLYGSAYRIVTRTDNVSKGATGDSAVEVKCGGGSMNSTNKIGVPVPVGATTTTTTVVRPAQ